MNLTILLGALCFAVSAPAIGIRGDAELDVLFPEHVLRTGGEVAYDSARDRLVRFGGNGLPLGHPPTVEWDGAAWIPIETQHVPPVREGHRLVYDAARHRVVLFGGAGPSDETWLYDGVDWTRAEPLNHPSARAEHGLAYDSVRQRVVLFGGASDSTTPLGDTWEWDGTDWTPVTAVPAPFPRKGHGMVFDAARGVTVLYRGQTYGTNILGTVSWFTITAKKMWEYNGVGWAELTPASLPGDGQFAHNPGRGAVELFGRLPSGGNFKLWTWSGSAWTSENFPSGPGVHEGFLDYLGASGPAITLYGKRTYSWDGARWTCLTLSSPITGLPQFAIDYSAWGDVDGNGFADRLAHVNLADPATNTIAQGKALFLNDGVRLEGTPVWTRRDDLQVTALALGDLTGDGELDAVFGNTSNDVPRRVEFYASADGVLSAEPTWQSEGTNHVAGFALADVNGDGRLDLTAAVRTTPPRVLVFLNNAGSLPVNPSLSFTLPANTRLDSLTYGAFLAWADVTYDGRLECAVGVVVMDETGDDVGVGVSVLALDAEFTGITERQWIEGASAPVAFLDADGDGYPDLLATRPGAGPALYRNADGAIASAPSWTAAFYGDTAVDLAVGDFDGDGDPDLVTGHPDHGTSSTGHLLYRNDGGEFGAYPSWRSRQYAGTEAVVGATAHLLDFDGDGVLDVASDKGVYLLDRVLRDNVPPLPPRYAVAHAPPPGSNQITIRWDASPDPDVAGYRVYRGAMTSGTDHTLIGSPSASETEFAYAHGAGFGEYFIRAVDEAGNLSAWSRTQKIGALPAARVAGDAQPDFSISGQVLLGHVTGDGRPEVFTQRSHETELWIDASWAICTVSPGGVFSQAWEHRWNAEEGVPGTPVLLEDATGDGRADLLLLRERPVDVGAGDLQARKVLDLYPALTSGIGFVTAPSASIVLAEGVTSIGACAWGDPYGDGLQHLVVSAYGADRKAVLFRRTGVDALSSTPVWESPATNIEAVAFGNQNNDGRDDLLLGEDIDNGGHSTPLRVYVHGGSANGPSVNPTWQDLAPGADVTGTVAPGNPVAVSWADYNADGRDDVTMISRAAAYMYRNNAGALPAVYSTIVVQYGIIPSKPAHELLGWANINGSGALDLYGPYSVILDAGDLTGFNSDDNYNSWKSRVTHPFIAKAVDVPWAGGTTHVLRHAKDLTGDGCADLITTYGNLVFLRSSGVFPPTLAMSPDRLVVVPGDPIALDRPGDRQAVTVTAVYTNATEVDVTDDAVFSLRAEADGREIVRMDGNEIVGVNPSTRGPAKLSIAWGNRSTDVMIHVAERPPVPASLRIAPGAATLTRIGEPLALSAIVTLEGGAEVDVTPQTTFTSSASPVVQVTGNMAVAGQNGVVEVTAESAGLSASATITTAVTIGIRELAISPAAVSLQVGEERRLETRVYYADGTSVDVTGLTALTSVDPGIAEPDGRRVVAVSPGETGVWTAYRGATAEARVAVGDPDEETIRILGLAADPAGAMLQWQATPRIGTTRDFRVWMCRDLADPDWEPAGNGIRAHPSGYVHWQDQGRPDEPRLFFLIETMPRVP